MNVLSLFDGISCGQVALERARIPVTNYYASEIEPSAIKITQTNYPNTIQLGDVTKIRGIDLPRINLLMGGSPCQGFSFAGKQLNFDDPRSALFFEFVRLKKELNPTYWLLENVKMKREYQDKISEILGYEPTFIDSADFSAQSRKRLYWTNLPIAYWQSYGEKLNDVLEPGWTSDREKSYCIDANYGKGSNVRRYKFRGSRQIVFRELPPGDLTIDSANAWGNANRDKWRLLTPEECEVLQTLPRGYTDVAGVSKHHRYHGIGNGWTVDVIEHIFKELKKR